MPNNPRLLAARKYLGLEHRYAETMLARLDAVDPMRREPGDEAVEAAVEAARAAWNTGANADRWLALSDLSIVVMPALTAALAVMAGESVAMEPEPPTDPPPEWTAANDKLHAAMNALLKLAGCDDLRPNRKDGYYAEAERAIEAAFPIAKPEPVWPPSGCIAHRDICRDHRRCYLKDCPHAGERADG